MSESLHTAEYKVFLRVLKSARKRSRMTQVQLAEKLQQTQSYVSKFERGELRLDIVQIRNVCIALGIEPLHFIEDFEAAVFRDSKKPRRSS